MFMFFFSSRRRHTRWTGDWSSDVCSSDLPAYTSLTCGVEGGAGDRGEGAAAGQRGVRRALSLNADIRRPACAVSAVKIGRASCRERVWIRIYVVTLE